MRQLQALTLFSDAANVKAVLPSALNRAVISITSWVRSRCAVRACTLPSGLPRIKSKTALESSSLQFDKLKLACLMCLPSMSCSLRSRSRSRTLLLRRLLRLRKDDLRGPELRLPESVLPFRTSFCEADYCIWVISFRKFIVAGSGGGSCAVEYPYSPGTLRKLSDIFLSPLGLPIRLYSSFLRII